MIVSINNYYQLLTYDGMAIDTMTDTIIINDNWQFTYGHILKQWPIPLSLPRAIIIMMMIRVINDDA